MFCLVGFDIVIKESSNRVTHETRRILTQQNGVRYWKGAHGPASRVPGESEWLIILPTTTPTGGTNATFLPAEVGHLSFIRMDAKMWVEALHTEAPAAQWT